MSNIKLVPFTENKNLKSKFENLILDLFGFSYDKKTFYLGWVSKSAKIIGIEEIGQNSSIKFANWNYNDERVPCSIYLSIKEQLNLKSNLIGEFNLRKKKYYLYSFNTFESDNFYQKII